MGRESIRRVRTQRSADETNPHPSETLDRWKSIASIASAIAIPFVLAIVGYFIQRQLANEGLKKDYVSIATSILKESSVNQEPELRRWAVTMLDANSPIPFSTKAKEGLERGIYISVAPPRIPDAPELCMNAPRGAKVMPLVNALSKKAPGSLPELANEYDKFVRVAIAAEAEAMEDRVALTCLQNYSRLVKQWTEETAASYAERTAVSPASAASR